MSAAPFVPSIELVPLSAEHLQLVTLADEAARAKLEAAEARHKSAYLAEMKAIQQAFEMIIQPVLAPHVIHEADRAQLTRDDNGVLCLEIVRRVPKGIERVGYAVAADGIGTGRPGPAAE